MQTSATEITAGISESGILSSICNFMEANSLGVEPGMALGRRNTFAESGVCSKDLSRVIDFIETEFGVYVSKYEVSEENFGSLPSIAHFVASNRPFAVG